MPASGNVMFCVRVPTLDGYHTVYESAHYADAVTAAMREAAETGARVYITEDVERGSEDSDEDELGPDDTTEEDLPPVPSSFLY